LGTQQQIAAGETYSRLNNFEFRVFTEQDIRQGYLLRNVRLMYQFSRHQLPDNTLDGLREFKCLKVENPFMLHELAEYFSPHDPAQAYYIILHLIYHHHLWACLDQERLRPDTTLRFSREGRD
jgi:hypothetical protein